MTALIGTNTLFAGLAGKIQRIPSSDGQGAEATYSVAGEGIRGPVDGGLRRAERAAPAASGLPWYHYHTGRCAFYLHGCTVVPYGHIQGRKDAFRNTPPKGKITTFSARAASRMRAFMMEHFVPGQVPFKFTLTTRAKHSPASWRRIWKRFRNRAKQLGVAFPFRVELQRRETPHVHGIVWLLPQGEMPGMHVDKKRGVYMSDPSPLWLKQRRLFWEGWLECIGEDKDPASMRHAVQLEPAGDNPSGWMTYCGLHAGKHKEEQLGWEGKQWGVVGEELFKRFSPVEYDGTVAQLAMFARLVHRWMQRGAENAYRERQYWITRRARGKGVAPRVGPRRSPPQLRHLLNRRPWRRFVPLSIATKLWLCAVAARPAASGSDATK